MILQRRIKLDGVGYSDIVVTKDVTLRSLDGQHGVHGAQQIEVYKDGFYRTMAVGSALFYGNCIIFKGFVGENEDNWNYQYHPEEWTLFYGEEQ